MVIFLSPQRLRVRLGRLGGGGGDPGAVRSGAEVPRMGRTRFVVSLLGLVLVAGGAPAVAAGVPDDQPLPGYTISNPPLTPEVVDGKPSRVLQGVDRHAAYTIEVPPNWNGRLTLWAHGYRGTGKVL